MKATVTQSPRLRVENKDSRCRCSHWNNIQQGLQFIPESLMAMSNMGAQLCAQVFRGQSTATSGSMKENMGVEVSQHVAIESVCRAHAPAGSEDSRHFSRTP